MMEVITSFTLKYALKIPGTAPQMAPQTIAARRHTYHGMWRMSGKIQGAEDTDGVLSGSTDVEQTCFKSKCNRKSGHNQGSGLSDFTSDSLRL